MAVGGVAVVAAVVVAVVVMGTAPIDPHVLAPVVGVGSAAEAGGPGVAEAECVGGEVELCVGVGGRGGGYAHGSCVSVSVRSV